MITRQDAEAAAEAISPPSHRTFLVHPGTFSPMGNGHVDSKAENPQKTGAFAKRGVFNKIISRGQREVRD